jgi:hypothetical protein
MKPKSIKDPIKARAYALLASLFFFVPTALLLWFSVNVGLSQLGDFIGSDYLWLTILIFSVVALVFPKIFPEMLGFIWWLMLKVFSVLVLADIPFDGFNIARTRFRFVIAEFALGAALS